MIVRRILFVTIGSLGDIDPYLAIAQALVRRGHCVTIASLARHAQAIRSTGAAFAHAQPDCVPGSPEDPLRKAFAEPGQALRTLMRELLLDQFDASYEAALPLVPAHDIYGPAPKRLRRGTCGGGVAATLARNRGQSEFTAFGTASVAPGPADPAARCFAGRREAVLRRPHGAVARGTRTHRSAGKADAIHDDRAARHPRPVLAAPRSGPRRLAAGSFGRRLLPPRPGGRPDKWRRARAFLGAGPPPVMFTQGSHSPRLDDHFFRASLQAARHHGLRALLIGRTAAELGVTEGPELACFARLPYGLAFPYARAVVTHAGIGTMARAIEAGRPILAVPAPVLDQPDNAFRANRLGVAALLPLSRYDGGNAAGALAHLLQEPRYGQAAARVAAAMARDGDGAVAAADAILAATDRRPPDIG